MVLSVELAKCIAMERYMCLLGSMEIMRSLRQTVVTWMDWGGTVCVIFLRAADGYASRVVCLVNRATGRVCMRVRG